MWQVWLAVVVAFVAYEAYALTSSKDRHHPFTYWVRRVLGLGKRFSLGWLAAAAFIGWLAFHFLVQQP